MLTAIVLAREDIREYDQRIALYTKERGLIFAYAVGVKKMLSKQSSRLEPCSFAYVETARSGSDKLLSAEPVAFFPNIRTSFVKSVMAQYIAGLVVRTVHVGAPDLALFNFLRRFFVSLDRAAPDAVVRIFIRALWRYVAIMGYNPGTVIGRPLEHLTRWQQFAEHHFEKSMTLPLYSLVP